MAKAKKNTSLPEQPIHLLPGEKVISVDEFELVPEVPYPVAIVALAKLAKVTDYRDIGKKGPLLASLSTDSNRHVKELRLFEAIFGRDSLRCALDVGMIFPELLKTTILTLATTQGIREDTYSEEEPGRIIHEFRHPKTDPIAQILTRQNKWQWPYYGSVDSTILFVMAIVFYCQHVENGILLLNELYEGRDKKKHRLQHALLNALEWIYYRMDRNPYSLIEYKSKFPTSIENQAWKDSLTAYHHADGSMANHSRGIASVEVQAYAIEALSKCAELLLTVTEHTHRTERKRSLHFAALCEKRADDLRRTFLTRFWKEDAKGGYFVLGTDYDTEGNLRQLAVRTSNMGHVLNTSLLEGDSQETVRKREALIRTLFSPPMLAASGIRTLAKNEARYRPGSYHNGSVWLWDTYYIAQGLEYQGYLGLAWELNRRILKVVNHFRKFPEFVRGDDSEIPQINTRRIVVWDEKNNREHLIEAPPQEIQAFSVASVTAIEYKLNQMIIQGKKFRAEDPKKRAFEEEILAEVKNRETSY